MAVAFRQQLALFIVDLNGAVYTAAGDPQAGFGPWSLVPGVRSRPGSRVTALPFGKGYALFVADTEGNIQTTSSRFPNFAIDGTLDVRVV
jgi:hypothetical protein